MEKSGVVPVPVLKRKCLGDTETKKLVWSNSRRHVLVTHCGSPGGSVTKPNFHWTGDAVELGWARIQQVYAAKSTLRHMAV